MKSEATIARIVLPLLAIALVGPALPWLRTPVLAQTPLSGDSGRIVLRTATLRYVVEGQGSPCIVYGVHLLYPRTFSQRFNSQLRCVYLDNRASLTRGSLTRLTPSDAFIARSVAGAAHYWRDSTYDASPLWKGVLVTLPLAAQRFDASRSFSFAAETAAVSVPVFVALGRYD